MQEDRRHHHRPFNEKIIEKYLAGRKVDSVKLFQHGKSNSNYKLLIEGETFVLRLHSSKTADRERTAMRLIEGLIPVPSIIATGDDWTLLSFIDCDHLTNHPKCLQSAVQTAARIWKVTFPEMGWINTDRTVGAFDFNGEQDFGTSMLQNPDVKRWLEPQAIKELAHIF